jgi:hypothetical protein
LIHADHLSGLFWSSNDGWEAAFWGVITCNTDFYEATAAVDDEGWVLVHIRYLIFKTYII